MLVQWQNGHCANRPPEACYKNGKKAESNNKIVQPPRQQSLTSYFAQSLWKWFLNNFWHTDTHNMLNRKDATLEVGGHIQRGGLVNLASPGSTKLAFFPGAGGHRESFFNLVAGAAANPCRCTPGRSAPPLGPDELKTLLTHLGAYHFVDNKISIIIVCKWTQPFWGTDCRRAPKSLSSAQAAPFAAPTLRELESACRVSIFWDAVTVSTVCFSGVLRGSPEGVSSSLRPKPSVSICSV